MIERKRIKVSEIFFIIFLLLVLALFLLIAWRYNVLCDLSKQNNLNLNKSNYYYYSKNNETITEYWKKDNVAKLNMKQINSDRDVTFWRNGNTGEEYTFYNMTMEYTEDGGMFSARPTSITTSYDNFNKFLLALNPTVFIWTKEYDGKECLDIKIGEQEELIEKETGLLLSTSSEGNVKRLSYSFDTVTDEDVIMPDISQYKLQEDKTNKSF